MSRPFSTLSSTARVEPTPFTVAIPKDRLTEMETLIKLAKLGPHTYENSQPDCRYGVKRDWLVAMREQWLRSYKWCVNSILRRLSRLDVDCSRKKSEERINSFPQWTTEIEGMTIHFVGLFSEKKDAIPILLIHGWPGKTRSSQWSSATDRPDRKLSGVSPNARAFPATVHPRDLAISSDRPLAAGLRFLFGSSLG